MYIWVEAAKKGSVLHSFPQVRLFWFKCFVLVSPHFFFRDDPCSDNPLYQQLIFLDIFPLCKKEKFWPILLPYCGMLLGEAAIEQE